MENKRREFLRNACAPVLMTALGIPMLEACGKDGYGGDEVLGGNSGGNRVVTIDLSESNFSNLGAVGGWVNYLAESLLLVRISDTEIRAFDNRCPHQGNRDGWSFDGSEFTCSYHSNSYENSCNGGLTCYDTEIDGTILTVTR